MHHIHEGEKKEPKATRPMVQSICDYRLPLHACIQDIRGKHCTRITSHDVYKINNTSITFPLMISILDLKSNDIKDFCRTLSFSKNSLTKKI